MMDATASMDGGRIFGGGDNYGRTSGLVGVAVSIDGGGPTRGGDDGGGTTRSVMQVH